MKTTRLFLLLGLCAVGFSSGYAAKRFAGGAPPEEAAVAESDGAGLGRERSASQPLPMARAAAVPAPVGPPSTDTLESLLAADDRSIFGRLALWMMDATEEEISAYWQAYRQRENRNNDINDLIFINWTRVNPQAAIAAAAGTPDAHYAWWAWACHDPQGSLAHAVSAHPEHIGHVGWGLGEFHGEWCRENWDDLPEAAKDRIIGGMTKWDDAADPQGILDFLRKTGNGFNQRLFESLVRKDPWAAYDWLEENKGIVAGSYGNADRAFDSVLKSLGQSQPGALERLAAQTSPGDTRRKIETAAFQQLLESDPEAAIKQAKNEEAPVIAAERLTAVGLSLVKSNPGKAFDLYADMIAADPSGQAAMSRIRYPGGGQSSGSNIAGSRELTNALLAHDPVKVLDLTAAQPQRFHNIAHQLAEQDLPGLVNWVNERADPSVRDTAVGVVANRLQNDGHLAEAAEWAATLPESQHHSLQSIFHNWSRKDPAEAAEWLEAADLPVNQRNQLNQILESRSN